MASGLKWQNPPQEAWPKAADAYIKAVRRGVHGVLMAAAPGVEAEMKSEAPWTDRTTNARQGLYTAVEPMSGPENAPILEFIMAHSVEYGAYLEGFDPRHGFSPTRQGQAYAIVVPTLDKWGPILWSRVKRMIRGK